MTTYLTPEDQEYIQARVGGERAYQELRYRVESVAREVLTLREENADLRRSNTALLWVHGSALFVVILIIGWLFYLGIKYGWLF